MKLRAGLLAVTVIAALAPLGSVASASPHFVALADPAVSIPPSFSFTAGCTGMDGSQDDLAACISVAIPDFNKARQADGLTPLVLPNDFLQLSGAEQLLTLTNIERVDRDLAPVAALSSRLNALAPALPTPLGGSSGGSDSFSGTSTLLAMYDWMYADGPSAWSNRHTILGTAQAAGAVGYDTPIAMGAAVSGGTVAVELIGGDTTDKADGTPTWDQIVRTSTFGLDQTNGQLIVAPGSQGSLTVLATSSSVNGTLDATMIHGADQWTVTPASCPVTPGSSCAFTVTFRPPSIGRFPGVLSITTGLSQKTVALAGVGGTLAAPRVSMNLSRFDLRRGQTLEIDGTVSNSNAAAIPVTLQTRPNGYTAWRSIGRASADQSGFVSFQTQPVQSSTYRLALLASNGNVLTASAPDRVLVRR